MTEYKPRLLRKVGVYKDNKFLEIDFYPSFVSEDEMNLYLTGSFKKQLRAKPAVRLFDRRNAKGGCDCFS